MVKENSGTTVNGTIWITGGTGFLGNAFLRSWKELFPGTNPLLLLRKEPEHRVDGFEYEVAGEPKRGFSYEELAEIRRRKSPSAIVHFATHFKNAYDHDDAEEMIDANIAFPIRILEACRGLSNLRFLNFGTYYSHVDGPISFYAASKRSTESFLDFYSSFPGWRSITLVLYDSYGKDDRRAKLIPKWVEILRTGETMKMSPGGQKICLLHVDDTVRGAAVALNLLFSARPEWKNGHRIYQLPLTDKLADLPTLKEVAGEFERAAGRKLPIEFGAVPYRPNEIMEPTLDFPILPGWKPEIDLLTGFRKILKGK